VFHARICCSVVGKARAVEVLEERSKDAATGTCARTISKNGSLTACSPPGRLANICQTAVNASAAGAYSPGAAAESCSLARASIQLCGPVVSALAREAGTARTTGVLAKPGRRTRPRGRCRRRDARCRPTATLRPVIHASGCTVPADDCSKNASEEAVVTLTLWQPSLGPTVSVTIEATSAGATI
jgi:hypothetical protein